MGGAAAQLTQIHHDLIAVVLVLALIAVLLLAMLYGRGK